MRRAAILWVAVLTPSSLAPFGCQSERAKTAFEGPQVLGGIEVSAATLERGRKLYGQYCLSCHAANGSGTGPAAASLPHPPRDFREGHFVHKSTDGEALPTHEDLRRVIRDGVVERGMPSWKGLRDEDGDALAHYIKTFSPRWKERPPGSQSGS